MVDLDPNKLLARGLTPLDIVNAVNAQNLTLPSGQAKIADTQYTVRTNAMPASIDDLNNIPVKYANGATVFLKDVGQVRDGYAVQQNIVREDGDRAVLLSVIKNGNASTLDVVNGVRNVLNVARAAAPPGLNINELFDQSIVRQIGGDERGARGRDRGRPDGVDDPLVPRLVAVDAHRHGVDPARHPFVADRALFSRRHHQHHDAQEAWRLPSASSTTRR